jgi:hypothetical protein
MEILKSITIPKVPKDYGIISWEKLLITLPKLGIITLILVGLLFQIIT